MNRNSTLYMIIITINLSLNKNIEVVFKNKIKKLVGQYLVMKLCRFTSRSKQVLE